MYSLCILPLFFALAFAGILPEESWDDASAKIVGGTQASKNEFPYQLRALIKRGNRNGLCGASIINSKYALTAAHCIDPKPDGVTLQVGYLDITKKTGGEYDVQVDVIKKHPNYNSSTYKNDIALLRISTTFQNTTGSQPVRLVASRTTPTGTAIATGWGTTREGGQTSNILMKVNLPILQNSTCSSRRVYGSSFDPNVMLCAGYVEGGKDTCQGDSGGPLVLNKVQVGVVSFGNGCARPNYPGVYTRVAAFRNWIDANAV